MGARGSDRIMTVYRLPGPVGLCFIENIAVLLDLRADRYVSVELPADFPTGLVKAFCRHADMDLLENSGLVTNDATGRPIGPVEVEPAIGSLLDHSRQAPGSLIQAAAIWAEVVRTRRKLALGGLEELVIASRPNGKPGSNPNILELAAGFLVSRKLVPLKPNCLMDSLVLRRHLAARGFDTRLIFGVKLHPFAAHCWLQHRGVLLNETLDVAAGFTPVFAA